MSSESEAADLTMSDDGPDRPLFLEAVEALRVTILDEHQSRFGRNASATIVLNELRALSTRDQPLNDRKVQSYRKLARFVVAFAPYFDVLSICTRVQTDWISYFWETFRVIIDIVSSYTCFLEKIADVFEAVSQLLPSYRQIYETYSRDSFSLDARDEDLMLTSLMSHVYADIVQLHLGVYRLFYRGLPEPDIYINKATSSGLWRAFDSRFSRLEKSITQHRKWLQKETRNHVQNYAGISQCRNEYSNFLESQYYLDAHPKDEVESQRLAKRLRRVSKITSWLSGASSREHQYEHIAGKENYNSCAWFIESRQYLDWKGLSFHRTDANDGGVLESNWQNRVLFVQAKKGFGKTFVSKAVAENLLNEADNIEIDDEPPTCAYFQVPDNAIEKTSAGEVFRSLACQILIMHKHDHKTLDTVCILLRKTSFQEKATTEEALEILSILLRQHPVYLVIDGIDDCVDIEEFLAMLARVCRTSDTRAILFSSPGIRIPLEYQKWATDAPHILSLTSEHNTAAIESYVTDSLNRMADQGFFGIAMDRGLIPEVAKMANGEFLWARLLLRFLKSQSLSLDERYKVLENIGSLRGLESLYRNALGALERRSRAERRIIADVFRWLTFPINQLSPQALRAALSTFDPSLSCDVCPAEIIEILPDLTCGLLQASKDRIFFSHSSIREYLQSPASSTSEFSLYDECNVHAQLAARCLSYLAHDIPKQPLSSLVPPAMPAAANGSASSMRTSKSGDSGYKSISSSDGDHNTHHPTSHPPQNASTTNTRAISFDSQLPFLRYAALCWPIHLSRALSVHVSHHATTVTYLAPLNAFLASRLAVTSWVEASLRYELSPTLTRLLGPLSDLKGELSPTTIEGRELRLVVNEMRHLNEMLVTLKSEYAMSLRVNPSLIWQLDGADSEAFWPIWEDVANGRA